MNLELRFLQKAIQDKNYISFTYEKTSYKKIKPYKIVDNKILHTDKQTFEFDKVKKLTILKDKF